MLRSMGLAALVTSAASLSTHVSTAEASADERQNRTGQNMKRADTADLSDQLAEPLPTLNRIAFGPRPVALAAFFLVALDKTPEASLEA